MLTYNWLATVQFLLMGATGNSRRRLERLEDYLIERLTRD